MCQEGVRSVSGGCQEGVRRVFRSLIRWSGGCQEGVQVFNKMVRWVSGVSGECSGL